ncbi:hypothetical protein QBC35DRAFT_211027 [Podospora australis]|uniref:Uncharacterized protein n=1 Tax=Podospora australis TaxID=1536484 RepID=A0AAN6WHV9_9PEZI|nr:hypothetical protein QBC35DRAFT_211027 [Podospora australis]
MASFRMNRQNLRTPERLSKKHRKPEPLQDLPELMEDIIYDCKPTTIPSRSSSSSTLVPSDSGDGSLLDYFDLPSPPSTPMKPKYSSLNSFPSPATSPEFSPSPLSRDISPSSSPSNRMRSSSSRSRSRSSSVSSLSSSSTINEGLEGSSSPFDHGAITIRPARRTPYYPPNSSRNVDRARVYMNRGPHFVPNWTPMSSLPRHVQLKIEERMTKFTA